MFKTRLFLNSTHLLLLILLNIITTLSYAEKPSHKAVFMNQAINHSDLKPVKNTVSGIEIFEEIKGKLWNSSDTDWVNWVVVNGTCQLKNNQEKLKFIDEFDPDVIDWYNGPVMNRGQLCRMRGVAVSGPEEYEYQEALQFTRKQTADIFTGHGIALKEDGQISAYPDYDSAEFMCLNSPKWFQVVQQGLLRLAPYGDSITQDNIGCPLYKGNAGFCDWCNRRFIGFMKERFSQAQLAEMKFNPDDFQIRDYLKIKRQQLKPEALIEDAIVHEYIRFQYISQLSNWVKLAQETKQTAVKLGRPVPALYGNQWGADGVWPGSVALSPYVDVVWIEQPSHQPCVDKSRQAWSTLTYKLGRAAGYFSRPVWTIQYPKKTALLSIALAEGHANGGLMVQCYDMDDNTTKSPIWDTHRHHAQFVSRNRVMFTDRKSVADVALVYSMPSTFWRNFSSLTVPSEKMLYDICPVDAHMNQFTTSARLLEDNHIPYEVFVLGHPDIFDDTPGFARISRYKTIILPEVDAVSDKQARLLTAFVRNGGQLILCGSAGTRDEELRLRAKPAFAELIKKPGQGRVTLANSKEEALSALSKNNQPLVKTDLPDSVWLNIWSHGAGPMTSVQMVNYDSNINTGDVNSVENFTIRLRCRPGVEYTQADYFALGQERCKLPIVTKYGYVQVRVPKLDIFGVVVFSTPDELNARTSAAETRKWFERLKIAKRCPGEIVNNDTTVLRQTEEMLGKIQGNVKVESFSLLAGPLDSLAQRLQAQVKQITEKVTAEREKTRTDALNINAVHKFDFGQGNCAKGWRKVRTDSGYTKENGFGWLASNNIFFEPAQPELPPLDYARDWLASAYPAEFRVDLANGEYIVTVISGDYDKIVRVGVSYVDVNGYPALLGDRLFSGYFNNRAFRTKVTDGKLILRFYGNNTGPCYANPRGWLNNDVGEGVGWLVNAVLVQQSDSPLTDLTMKSLAHNDMVSKTALRQWSVIGPFEDNDCTGMSHVYPPEKRIDLAAEYKGKNGTVKWQQFSQPQGSVPYVQLSKLLNNSTGVAYLLTYVRCPDSIDAILTVSTSQVGVGYVNGELVFRDIVAAGLMVNEKRVSIKLNKGWNTILIKTLNVWGSEWSAWAGLMTEDGKPLESIDVSATGNRRAYLSLPTEDEKELD